MKKGDKIILLIVVIVFMVTSIGIHLYKSSYKDKAGIVVIKQDGKILKTIDFNKINKAQQIKIPYKDGSYNIVLVEKGRVRFSDSDCPDKICVKAGWLTKVGDNAACLPHRILIKIEGENKKVDDVTY